MVFINTMRTNETANFSTTARTRSDRILRPDSLRCCGPWRASLVHWAEAALFCFEASSQKKMRNIRLMVKNTAKLVFILIFSLCFVFAGSLNPQYANLTYGIPGKADTIIVPGQNYLYQRTSTPFCRERIFGVLESLPPPCRTWWQDGIAISAGRWWRDTGDFIPRRYAPRLPPDKTSSVNPLKSLCFVESKSKTRSTFDCSRSARTVDCFLYDQTNRRVTVDAENEVLKNYEWPFVIHVSPANGW